MENIVLRRETEESGVFDAKKFPVMRTLARLHGCDVETLYSRIDATELDLHEILSEMVSLKEVEASSRPLAYATGHDAPRPPRASTTALRSASFAPISPSSAPIALRKRSFIRARSASSTPRENAAKSASPGSCQKTSGAGPLRSG